MSKIPRSLKRKCVFDVVQVLARLHQVDYVSVGLKDYGKSTGYCGRLVSINPNRAGGWHNVPQNFHLNLILLAIVHPDGNRTIFSRALLGPDF